MITISRNTLISVLATSLILISSIGISWAKDPPGQSGDSVPPPAGHAKKGKPDTGNTAINDRLEPPSDDEVAEFQKGYKHVGRPSMLVLCGLDARASGVVKVGTQALACGQADKTGGGAVLLDFDPTGFCDQFASSLAAPLNPDGRTKFKDLALMRAKEEEMKSTLATAGEDGALETIGKSLNIDLILYLKFTPRTKEQIADDQRPLAAVMSLKWVGDATMISFPAFDVDGKFNSETANIYANTINKRWLIPKFAKLDPGRDISLSILGADQSQLSAMRKIIEKLDNVDGDVSSRVEPTKDDEKATVFDFSIKNHKVADLVDDFTAAVKAQTQVACNLITQNSNEIVMRVEGAAVAGVTGSMPWIPLINEVAPDPQNVRSDFQTRYEQKGRPSVAIFINQMLRGDQTREQGYVKVHEIGTGDDAKFNRNEIGGNTIVSQTLEDELSKVFRDAKFKVFSASEVRKLAAARLGPQLDETQLNQLLARTPGYDLLIYGLSGTEEPIAKPAGGGASASVPLYTFKIFDVRTGELLGTQKWDATELAASKKYVKKPDDATQVAQYIGGQLIWQIYKNRLKDATEMNVVIHGVDSDRSVESLATALKTNVDEIVSISSQSYNNGEGHFTIRYIGNFEDFKKKLIAQKDRMPLEMKETETSASTLVLEVSKGK